MLLNLKAQFNPHSPYDNLNFEIVHLVASDRVLIRILTIASGSFVNDINTRMGVVACVPHEGQ